jgi:hypothetical protein
MVLQTIALPLGDRALVENCSVIDHPYSDKENTE